jgi:hypothetical protein
MPYGLITLVWTPIWARALELMAVSSVIDLKMILEKFGWQVTKDRCLAVFFFWGGETNTTMVGT